ncbi:prefoldin subunit 3 [Leptonychotes weddellii]|uniref:Prefoldin subunit 3 n=1 Tax=Leptonychotes weddellii TaxID=9713 RepID=A0A7F8R2Y1_LEPWE|nr:prefoldin subunit 3 [Leptonychotes weddellii]
MAAAKDGCGLGEVATGNGRRLHLGIPEAVFVEWKKRLMIESECEGFVCPAKELRLLSSRQRAVIRRYLNKGTTDLFTILSFFFLKESTSSLETRFLLADNLYCKASVPPTDKVCLWLGANVMLEYDIDEAQALLEKNLSTATKNLDSLEEDLDFLRDQFTTTEVNMARVYNWDVKRRNKDDSTKNKA